MVVLRTQIDPTHAEAVELVEEVVAEALGVVEDDDRDDAALVDERHERALDVGDKSRRVANFHRNTMKALAEMAGAAGLEDPCSFLPHHFMQRDKSGEMLSGDQAWRWLPEGFLISGEPADAGYLDRWNRARPDSFKPV